MAEEGDPCQGRGDTGAVREIGTENGERKTVNGERKTVNGEW